MLTIVSAHTFKPNFMLLSIQTKCRVVYPQGNRKNICILRTKGTTFPYAKGVPSKNLGKGGQVPESPLLIPVVLVFVAGR